MDVNQQVALGKRYEPPTTAPVTGRRYDETSAQCCASGSFVVSYNARIGLMYPVTKRVLDFTLALFGLLLLAPAFVLIAILIRLDSAGPILYRRRALARQTYRGTSENLRTFTAWKFRTMIVGAEEYLRQNPHLFVEYEREYKLPDDPRVTRLGAVLRALNLDELPQLVNVLCGQMSLVGPRIISPPELERYGEQKRELLSVKPGITGWWQVNGRHRVPYRERVQLDLWYIVHRSFRLDLHILLRTLWYLLFRQSNFEHCSSATRQ